MSNFNPEIIFFAIVAIIVGTFIFKTIKNGGFKAALFGAEITNTYGEVTAASKKSVKTTFRIHSLQSSANEKLIGVEMINKTFASYHMMPITLSKEESRKLITLLQKAIDNENS